MASLQHRGMINGLSIVWKEAASLEAGDSVVRYIHGDSGYSYIIKVKSVEPLTYNLMGSYSTSYRVTFDDGTVDMLCQLAMVRIPPQNPRVVYAS